MYGQVGFEQESRGLQDFALMLDECASAAADVLKIQAVGHRKREFVRAHGLLRRFRRIDRSRDDRDAELFQIGEPCLIVSQLLTAVSSPVAAVQQHHAPPAGGQCRNALRAAADQRQIKIGETVPSIQLVAQTLCHV